MHKMAYKYILIRVPETAKSTSLCIQLTLFSYEISVNALNYDLAGLQKT